MTSRKYAALVALLVVVGLSPASADHVLATNGKILYNVVVPDGATSGGAVVRIRTTPASFEFDPKTNAVLPVQGFSVARAVADLVKTHETVGRDKARDLATQRNWTRYVHAAPPRPRLIMPTPAPKFTPAPMVERAEPTPVPADVVPEGMPLNERLDKQLEIFLTEQSTLARDGATSVVQGVIKADQVHRRKVQLLQRQRGILQQYFPVQEESVKLSLRYWGEQIQRAEETGRFDLENL